MAGDELSSSTAVTSNGTVAANSNRVWANGNRAVATSNRAVANSNRAVAGSGTVAAGDKTLFKVFNDSVHGTITLPPLCVAIIDTPQFQRLRCLKQTYSSYLVFPAASHNRFEHSLGVAYLGGEMVDKLREQQPELRIDNRDALCVRVAGLCHDLGHGPFSHFWQEYMKQKRPERKWKHEKASQEMLQHLLKENDIRLENYGLDENDLVFINELIKRPLETNDGLWPCKGRGQEKSFLYEIISNERNNVDVDKWDYFLRDSHGLGVRVTFSYRRLMEFSRVLCVKGDKSKQICFRDKEVENIIEMFHNRYMLHKKAYQHRTSIIIDQMLLDAFMKVDHSIKFKGDDGEEYSLSKVVDNMSAYSKLCDDVLQQLQRLERDTSDPGIAEAQDIVLNIQRRELYPRIAQTRPDASTNKEVALKNYMTELLAAGRDARYRAAEDSFIIFRTKLNYGNKEQNPIRKIWFYSKTCPDVAFQINESDVSAMLPKRYEEVWYTCISRSYDTDVNDVIATAFDAACFHHGLKKK
uniref:Deoxynucleoside triphosphate triphosphohydrolase SAMHD1 isoform X3 n=1 Tax=Hirondellea gigas TaxID=1518452 RepID=A0A6A7G1X5_9CRUS